MMRPFLIAFAVAITACSASLSVVAETPTISTDAPQTLFNGNDLSGWSGDPRLWSVRDGIIHGETTPERRANGNTFLIWQGGEVGDFELTLSFRCNATNNSGIQYRSRHITDDSAKNDWVVRGYQHEVRNEIEFPNIAGFIYDEGGKRRRICMVGEKAIMKDGQKQVVDNLITADEFKELFQLDGWNEVTIRARGRRIEHVLNGRTILDFTDSVEQARLRGVIALQLHAGKPMWAEFKNIQLKAL